MSGVILELYRRCASLMEQLHRPPGKEIPAPAGIDIHQHRQIGSTADPAHLLRHLLQAGQPQIRLSKGGIGDPRPGNVERAKARLFGQFGREGVDDPGHLQRTLPPDRLAKLRPRRHPPWVASRARNFPLPILPVNLPSWNATSPRTVTTSGLPTVFQPSKGL